jgi:hypothetical protein
VRGLSVYAGKNPLDTAAASPLTYVLVVLGLSAMLLDRKMDLALAPGEFVTLETMTMLSAGYRSCAP